LVLEQDGVFVEEDDVVVADAEQLCGGDVHGDVDLLHLVGEQDIPQLHLGLALDHHCLLLGVEAFGVVDLAADVVLLLLRVLAVVALDQEELGGLLLHDQVACVLFQFQVVLLERHQLVRVAGHDE